MSLIKFATYTVGGAVGLCAATAFGGVGIVAGGAAIGLSVLEVAVVGGAAGASIYKVRHDQADAKRKTQRAYTAQQNADAQKRAAAAREKEFKVKVAKARQVLQDLDA
jgi:hypothetical protein